MADLLQSANAFLRSQRASCMAHAATYSRLSTSVTVNVTVGLRDQVVNAADGSVMMIVHSRDFILTAADLAAFTEPLRGDRIVDDGHTYEVLPMESVPCWQWADQGHIDYRIHTKEVLT